MNFEYVWERFNPILGDLGSVCIAGGCVRDQLLGRTAKDFDLFILSDKSDFNFEESKQKVAARVSGFTQSKPVIEWHKSEPYLVAAVDFEGVEVQIMVNPARTLPELVSTFDWNVCLFGYDGMAVLKGNLSEIKPGGTLSLNKVTFPLSTLRRGYRFSERFVMKLKNSDIQTLCRQILDNAAKGKDIGPTGNEPDMPALAAQMTEENPF